MSQPKAKEIVASNPVVVFSKSYCPFCVSVKKLLTEIGASYKVIELDTEDNWFVKPRITLLRDCICFHNYEGDGSQLQAELHEWTGQRTVPNVFIGGKHIGGCDATTAMHKGGKLLPLLTEAGVVAKSSA